MKLHVENVPKGWKATLLGGGQPVAAAMPGTDNSVGLDLRLEIPADTGKQPPTITVEANGGGHHMSLLIDIALDEKLPAKLSLKSKLLELQGSAESELDYELPI